MKGIVEYCPEEKCGSEFIYFEEENDFFRCYKCRKIFYKPKTIKKIFKTVSLFGDEI